MKSILRLQLTLCPSSAPYNNFTLNTLDKYNIIVCSFSKPEIKYDSRVEVLHANGGIIKYFLILRRILINNKLDVIHAHTVHVACLFILACLISKISLLKKSIFTVHNSYENYHFRNKLLFLIMYKFFNKIVYCSKSSKESFKYKYFNNKQKNYVIKNGVNWNQITSDYYNEFNSSKYFNIVVVGRLIKIKQPQLIVDAYELLDDNNVRLIFIGDGPEKENLLFKSSSKIIFKGIMKRVDVYKELYKSHLFISMSKTEGMPIAPLEAMSCKLPVILSDIKAHRELFSNLINSDLIKENRSVLDLKSSIQRYLIMSNKDRKSIGEINSNYVKKEFSISKMLLQYDKLYNNIIFNK